MPLISGRARVRRGWWKIALALLVAWTVFNVFIIGPTRWRRTIAEQRGTGLASVSDGIGWDPIHLWRQSSFSDLLPGRRSNYFREAGHQYAPLQKGNSGESDGSAQPRTDERKIVRATVLEIEVKSPAECVEKIRRLAERMGGYMVSSEVSGNEGAPGAGIALRVPSERLEEVRTEIKKLAMRVDSEKTEANDVTRDYVDKEARLHNLRAQEQQYLAIMKRASTVTDTLEVSSRLNEVRGEIEKDQAEFVALSSQVETVAITVTLRTEAEAKVFGIRWQPLFELKLAMRDGLESRPVGVAAVFCGRECWPGRKPITAQ